jgi:hypothetical protein
MPESIFASPTAEESAPAWTPAPAVVPDPVQPATEVQPEQGQAEHEGEHGKWFDRAKMWAANNLYDPDEDESVIKPEGDNGQDVQNR